MAAAPRWQAAAAAASRRRQPPLLLPPLPLLTLPDKVLADPVFTLHCTDGNTGKQLPGLAVPLDNRTVASRRLPASESTAQGQLQDTPGQKGQK